MHPRELIEEFYGRFVRGDIEGALDLCTEDIDFEWPVEPSESVSFAGRLPSAGRAAFRVQLARLAESFDYETFAPDNIVIEGDRVAIQATLRMKPKAGDKMHDMRIADFWTIREGKLAALVQYYDTALASGVLFDQASKD